MSKKRKFWLYVGLGCVSGISILLLGTIMMKDYHITTAPVQTFKVSTPLFLGVVLSGLVGAFSFFSAGNNCYV
jgi:hypothetical protein